MKHFLLFTILCFTVKLNSQTQAYLDANNVKAMILNRNDMFWDLSTQAASYEVPKNSGKHCNFVNSVWMGGLDAGAQLHMAGMTYRQNGFDFWPGPLDTINGTTNSTTTAAFDKVWKINATEIASFTTAWNNGSVTANTYTPSNAILTWPANGNTAQGYAHNLAPYVDVNGDGFYDPLGAGDYPLIKGDQMIYYIVNDKYQVHTETNGVPLGIEMHVSAYAYNCPATLASYPPLNNTTFYHYKIINRSYTTYSQFMTGIFSDIDLGTYSNDYIGCDPSSNIGYAYNATASDGAYGNYPPIVSYQILKGPSADPLDGIDNNHNGTIDETMEDCRMNRFMFFNNNIGPFPPATCAPAVTLHYYNYLTSMWKDGTPLRADSTGYFSPSSTVQATPYAYPGNPQTNTGWTEYSKNNIAGDRRFIIGNGPVTFAPNETIELEFSILTTFDSTAAGHKNIAKMKNQNALIKTFYNLPSSPCMSSVGLSEKSIGAIHLVAFPNPASESITIHSPNELRHAELRILNSLGQVVKKDSMTGTSKQVNVSDLPQGLYFVDIMGNNIHATVKFIRN